jgi:hypothetical protein
MRAYRQRPGVRERELANKREYDAFHQAENRARWQRRNQERKDSKAEWYARSAERIAKDRKTRRDYIAKYGRVPKAHRWWFKIADMRKALDTGNDPFADLRTAWREGAKRGAKQGAATRKRDREHRALWEAFLKRFGPDSATLADAKIYRLMRKSLKDGHNHVADEYARREARNEPGVIRFRETLAEMAAQPLPAFSAKDERDYTRMVKKRKLFEGACDLRWPEYFEYRQANSCARLTANDLRYAGQYTACAAPKR